MNIFLLIALILISTFLLGKLLEKIRIPWIFAALIFGAGLAFYNPFEKIISSESFKLLSQIGMLLLLFLVGFELDLKKLKKRRNFIFKSAFFIIFLEGILGSFAVHYIFNYSWSVSFIVSLSFATVGEAVLIPILHEFNLINTNLGQAIVGIGTADDFIEIILLLIISILVNPQYQNIIIIIVSIFLLTILTIGFKFFGEKRDRFRFLSIETLFLLVLFSLFLFIGIGSFSGAQPLAAIIAGASVRLFVNKNRLSFIESEIKSLTYGFFAPLFFVSIGAELNLNYLFSYPLLILLIVLVSKGAKLIGSYITAKNILGVKGSILLGIGLSVRFSASIIIIKLLFDNNLIGKDLYSVIIASSIIFKFIIPIIFSWLIVKWRSPKISPSLS